MQHSLHRMMGQVEQWRQPTNFNQPVARSWPPGRVSELRSLGEMLLPFLLFFNLKKLSSIKILLELFSARRYIHT